MGRLSFIWTATLVAIIVMGLAPFLLAALGYGLFVIGSCGAASVTGLCNWVAGLRFMLIFGYGTIPAMAFALVLGDR